MFPYSDILWRNWKWNSKFKFQNALTDNQTQWYIKRYLEEKCGFYIGTF